LDDRGPIRQCASKLPHGHRRHDEDLVIRRLRWHWRPDSFDGNLLRSRANSDAHAHTNSDPDRNAVGDTIAYTNSNGDSERNTDSESDSYAQSNTEATPDSAPTPNSAVTPG
jgi:hypothetical protein